MPNSPEFKTIGTDAYCVYYHRKNPQTGYWEQLKKMFTGFAKGDHDIVLEKFVNLHTKEIKNKLVRATKIVYQ